MMSIILSIIDKEWSNLWRAISFQTTGFNYFWMLVIVSVLVGLGEKFFPWRKEQPVFRKQFWLDTFYMFFNYFLFRVIFMGWVSFLTGQAAQEVLGGPITNHTLFDFTGMNPILLFILFFLILDFVQWATHRMLHWSNFLWKFHMVHHSVEEMSFPAHLRYHWMENVIYTPVKYLTVTLIFGFPPQTALYAYVGATIIGHLNHANMRITYGPLKYVLNNPVMHLWHHARKLPRERWNGVNFGISLSLWDYIFKTNYQPYEDKNLPLGFPGLEKFPTNFFAQEIYPIKLRKKSFVKESPN